MRYYTLKEQLEGEYTRSKNGKIMLFASREDAIMYRDAYYGAEPFHFVQQIEVPQVGEDHQLMTAIHWWETREK